MKSRIIILTMLCCLAFGTASAFTPGDPLYISDHLVGLSGVSGAKQFTYNSAKNLYSYSVAAGTTSTETGDFALSTHYETGTNMLANWRKEVVWAPGYDINNETGAQEIVPDGRSYTLSYANGSGSVSRWMSINSSYSNTQGYTIYVSGDLSKMWVVEDLYVSDQIVGNNAIWTNHTRGNYSKKFEYNVDELRYELEIPGGSVARTENTADVQLSTKIGDYSPTWKSGLYYANPPYSSSDDDHDPMLPGIPYGLTKTTDTEGHWMTIGDYDNLKAYTLYVNNDKTSFNYDAQKKLYINGNFNGIGYSKYDVFEFDNSERVYKYTGTSGLNGTIGLFHAQGTSYRVSCKNYTSDDKLDVNGTIYELVKGSGGEQQLNLPDGATSVTIYIDEDMTMMWVTSEGGESASNYYLADYDEEIATEAKPAQFTKNANGSYSYALPPLDNSVMWISVSPYRSGANDNSSFGFTATQKTAYGLTLNGDPVSLTYGDSYITIPAGYSRVITISADGSQISVAGEANRPKVYMNDVALGLVQKYQIGDVKEMTFDEAENCYKLFVDYTVGVVSGSYKGDFQFSITPANETNSYDQWKKGLIWLSGASGSGNYIVADGTHYRATYDPNLNNTTGCWQTISNYDLTDGYRKGYTFYVSGDFSEFWVEQEFEDIYLSDYLAGVTDISTGSGTHKFKYDHDKGQYYYEATAANQKSTGSDFQISRTTGTYAEWKTGLLYVDGGVGTTSAALDVNTEYTLTKAPSTNENRHWMTINGWVHGAKDYIVYVSGDLSKVWVKSRRANVQSMYIIGHLTNHLEGAYEYTGDNHTIERMEYDEDNDYYKFTMAGARWSVFELSETAPPCAYTSWVDGMYAFMPSVDGKPITQPVISTNPFNGNEENFIKYKADKGKYYETNPNHDLYMRDMSIEGYNPDWLYTVYISGDKTKIWVTEQPINMPLKAMDFIDQTDLNNVKAIPHYFVVGTRTADWRLLPEWEFKPGTSATDMYISGRFMYDGYFAIAKVDNYLDYIHHRYQVFANDNEDQDFTISDNNKAIIESSAREDVPLHTIRLVSCGNSHALHYDDNDFKPNGDPIHDIHNSITWDIGIGGFATEDGKVTSKMMRYALPFRFSRLTLTLDADGNPTQLTPVGSYNRKVINKYRTFVLMGTDINYENEFDLQNCLGVRDLRKMTPAYQAKDANTHELNWANSWISWDNQRMPYYDAFQNTLFMTAYDKDWQNSSLCILDTPEGKDENNNTVWTEFSSDHLVFELADPDSDPEYGWVYRNHPSDGTNGSDIIGYIPDEGQEGTWDSSTYSWKTDEVTGEKLEPGTGHYNVVSDFTPGSNTGYKYQERLANYDINPMADAELHGNKLGDDQTVPEGGVEGDGWVCYVLKNVSLKGDFIVTSGWSGNLATSEGYDPEDSDNAENMPRNNLRLYFGNFSPRRGAGGVSSYSNNTWAYTVRGFDLKTTATDVDHASDNIKLGYRTYRDIDETNFQTQGTDFERFDDGTYTNDVTMQNYDRIILWYNTNVSRTQAEIPNGVIQFVQESISPSARMYFTKDKDGKYLTNQFTVNWNIIDNTISGNQTSKYANWKVLSYTISRYHYVTEAGSDNRVAKVYRVFPTVEPENMTVSEVLSGKKTFDDPYSLPPGTYFYTVEVTILNPKDDTDVRTKTATTNTMTVAEPAKTAVIDMEQVMEDKLYTFNVKAKPRLTSNTTVLNTESHYLTSVWKDVGYLEITADRATATALNNATFVEILNPMMLQVWNADGSTNRDDRLPVNNPDHPFNESATIAHKDYAAHPTPYLGWGLDNDCKDGNGNPMFVLLDDRGDDDETNDIFHIRYNFRRYYYSSNDNEDFWNYFWTKAQFDQVTTPEIVWHNVKPTENILGTESQYKLTAYIGPMEGNNKVFYDSETYVEMSYDDYWKNVLGFTPDDASTGVYAPAPEITMTAQLAKSAHQGNYTGFDRTDEAHIRTQPVGAHGKLNNNILAQAPVHYTDLNEVNAHITTYIPVTNEVLENVNIGYENIVVKNVTEDKYTPAVEIAQGKYKDAKTNEYTSDVDATLHHLPLDRINFSDEDDNVILMGKENTGKYSHEKPKNNKISYRLNNIIPKYSLGDVWEVSPANTKSVSATLDFTDLNALEFITNDYIFTRYTDSYLKTVSPEKPNGMRFFAGIEVDGKTKTILDDLYAYYGFNIEYTPKADSRIDIDVDFSGLGNHVQGGCPIHGYVNNEDYRDNWQGLWNPQGVDLAEDDSNAAINPTGFRVKPIDLYRKYDGSTYSSAHNWSRLAAENNYLSVAYGPLAVSKSFEQVYWPEYTVNLTGYVTIPLIPYGEVTTYIKTGAKKVDNMSPAPQYAPETTTSIIHGNIVPLTFQAPALEYNKANIMTGIEGVETNDLEGAIFYNMQGVEVPNPQRGEIYIVKHRDGKVTREVYLK